MKSLQQEKRFLSEIIFIFHIFNRKMFTDCPEGFDDKLARKLCEIALLITDEMNITIEGETVR